MPGGTPRALRHKRLATTDDAAADVPAGAPLGQLAALDSAGEVARLGLPSPRRANRGTPEERERLSTPGRAPGGLHPDIEGALTPASPRPLWSPEAPRVVTPSQPESLPRAVRVNAPDPGDGYADNRVTTSKYTVLSFLPRFLWQTFRRIASFYFLVIGCLQTIPAISNTGGIPTTLLPLTIVTVIDGFFEALEDVRRHRADEAANALPSQRLDPATGVFETVPRGGLRPGDVVRVSNREFIPADVLLLHAAGDLGGGGCYVETKKLDGETNLKLRQVPEELRDVDVASVGALRGLVRCEAPNNNIHRFVGSYQEGPLAPAVPVSNQNLLLRGTSLRNTAYVLGVVVNAGHDTKMMQAVTHCPHKVSSIDRKVNKQILAIVAMLSALCSLGTVASIIMADRLEHAWYLGPEWEAVSLDEAVVTFFYYGLLMANVIPVSLYVSMTMVRAAQAYLMGTDLECYDEASDAPMEVRTMSLNDELGQISHIFSDKTGTLTQNLLEFRKCSINGVSYGRGTTEIGMATLQRAGRVVSATDLRADSEASPEPFVNFWDPAMDAARAPGSPEAEFIDAFFLCLACCHTVIPERLDDGSVHMSASSPDEQALVAAARYFGHDFVGRVPGRIELRVRGEPRELDVLEVFEFSSARKRSSVVVRDAATGAITLYCKGADSVVLPRLAPGSAIIDDTTRHLEAFAEHGLRTLLVASRPVDAAAYAEWAARFQQAENSATEVDRRRRDLPNAIDDLIAELEVGLQLMGATAVEDKLQAGVPRAVGRLRQAGIQMWVLTGDQLDTAVNVGFACQLITNSMQQLVVSGSEFFTTAQVRAALELGITGSRRSSTNVAKTGGLALIIDGAALELALHPDCREVLALLSRHCASVVACRMSPRQKSQLVELVRFYVPMSHTLAIGDGANDVGMIQAAHVGVGVSGNEGTQAVNASDYAIGQFRFLQRLLLVHGRFHYQRMAVLVPFIFYKNVLLAVLQFSLAAMSDGQKYFNEAGVQGYNTFFTSVPIVLLAIFDRDVSDAMLDKYPGLYGVGRKGKLFNTRVFWRWIATAVYEAVAVTVLTLLGLGPQVHPDGGHPATLFTLGGAAFTLAIVIANLKVALNLYSWRYVDVLAIAGSIALWFAASVAFSNVPTLDALWYKVFEHLFANPAFWLLALLAPVVVLGPEFFFYAYAREVRPTFSQLVQELEADHLASDEFKGLVNPDAHRARTRPPADAERVQIELTAPSDVSRARRISIMLADSFSKVRGFVFSQDEETAAVEAAMCRTPRDTLLYLAETARQREEPLSPPPPVRVPSQGVLSGWAASTSPRLGPGGAGAGAGGGGEFGGIEI